MSKISFQSQNNVNRTPVQTRAIDGKNFVVGRKDGKEILFADDGALAGSRYATVTPVKMGKGQAAVYAFQDKVLNVKNTAAALKPIFKLAVAAAAGYGVWGLAHVLFGTVLHLNPHLTLGLSIAAVAMIPAAFALLAFMSAKGKYEAHKAASLKQDAAYTARVAAGQNEFNAANPPKLA